MSSFLRQREKRKETNTHSSALVMFRRWLLVDFCVHNNDDEMNNVDGSCTTVGFECFDATLLQFKF
jgi:hypothetical protein